MAAMDPYQLAGNPQYGGGLSTGQLTLSGSAGDQFANPGQGYRVLWISTPSTNAGDVFYGNATSSNSNGTPIPKGGRVLVTTGNLGRLFFQGTSSDVVAFEGWR